MSTNREQLTFGNWRRPASIGLFGLGQAGTFLALGGVAVGTITIMLAGVFIGLVVFAVIAVLIFLVVRRDKHQKSLVDRSSERVGFARAKASGTTTYRSVRWVRRGGALTSFLVGGTDAATYGRAA